MAAARLSVIYQISAGFYSFFGEKRPVSGLPDYILLYPDTEFIQDCLWQFFTGVRALRPA